MEGADIYQIAKNCRASVEMIEKYYPAHKTRLDAAAINVMRRHNRRSKTGNTDGGVTNITAFFTRSDREAPSGLLAHRFCPASPYSEASFHI
jgi:hypothetical protein